MARVFISHSSKDGEQAARILEWLRAKGFEGAFLDFDKHAGIPPGADWERTLYREIARAEAIILIVTANWSSSKWCFAEFTQARALGKAIFPLIESPADEAYVARDIQHLDLRKDREGGLEQLATRLTEIALNSRGPFEWDIERPPFPGLLAYDEPDAAIYFGRDDDIRRLIERLNARRAQGGAKMVALLGASGSGKSSLMRAGLLPRLKRDKRNWIVLPPFRPQKHPLDEIAQAIALALKPKSDWRNVRELLAAENLEQSLHNLAHDLRTAYATNDARIVVSIDQGEELFGTADKTDAEKFWTLLDVMLTEHLPFIVLLSLRSDYLGQLQQVSGLSAQFDEFSLKPLPLERVRDIINGPADVVGFEVEDAMITAAIKDAATEDALPLLAFALRELYDRFGGAAGMTLAAYGTLGDEKAKLSPIENAVRQRADQVLAEAKPTDRQLRALKDAFVPAMVRVNAEGEYVRHAAAIDKLPALARPLIEQLENARLLVKRPKDSEFVVEVAHEALLRKWPLLRGWLDEEREFLLGKQQLEQDLHDWQTAPQAQKSEALLAGLKLTRARSWLINMPQQLSNPERQFIAASIARLEEEQRRREADRARQEKIRRYVLVGSVAASVVLLVAAAVAVWQWRAAVKSEQAADVQKRVAVAERDNAEQNLASALLGKAALAANEKEGYKALVYLSEAQRISQAGSWPTRSILIGAPVSKRVAIFDIGVPVSQIRFHPTRNIVAARTPSGIEIIDLSRKSPSVQLRNGDTEVGEFVFHPLTNRILARSLDKLIYWSLEDTAARDTAQVAVPKTKKVLASAQYGLAVSDEDGTIYYPAAGSGLQKLDGRTFAVVGEVDRDNIGDWIAQLSLHPSDHYVAASTGNFDEIAVYDTKNKSRPVVLGAWERSARTVSLAVAFSPDGKFLAAAQKNGVVRVWQVKANEAELSAAVYFDAKGSDAQVLAVTISPDSTLMAIAHDDLSITVWNLSSTRLISRISGHRQAITSVAFTPDGRHLASGSLDGTIQFWQVVPQDDLGVRIDLGSGRFSNQEFCSTVFSRDGSKLALAAAKGGLWMHATQDIGPDARRKLLVGEMLDRPVTGIINLERAMPARVYDFATHLMIELEGPSKNVYCMQFAQNDRYLVGSVPNENKLVIWEMPTGKVVGSHEFKDVAPRALVVDEKLDRMAIALTDGSIEIGVLDGLQYIATSRLNRKNDDDQIEMPGMLLFSKRGDQLFAGGYQTSTLWNLKTGTAQVVSSRPTGAAESFVGFVGDFEFFAFETPDKKLVVKSATDGNSTAALIDGWISGRGFGRGLVSSTGRYLAVGVSDGSVVVWDSDKRAVRTRLVRDIGRLDPMCFDADGKILVVQVNYDINDKMGYEASGHFEFWDIEHSQRIGELSVTNLASDPLLRIDGAILSVGQPRLAFWIEDTLFVKSGVSSTDLEKAEETSGYAMKGSNLERLPVDDPREAPLLIRTIEVDQPVASFWPIAWRLERELAKGADAKQAAASIRKWLQENMQHPFRVRVPDVVEGFLASDH
jgi:WD40 repeat protein